MGYSLGCLLSILFWGINREALINTMVDKITGSLHRTNEKDKFIGAISIIIIIIYFSLFFLINKEIYNFLTLFLVINISNKEKQNMEYKESNQYESSIENLCDGIICGFIAPLCIIMIAGNIFAVIYFFLIILDRKYYNRYYHMVVNVINIIPCFIVEILIVIINIYKVNKLKNFFAYSNLKSFITEPLLGVSILWSYLYEFTFSTYKHDKKSASYIEYYGPEKSIKLDAKHIDSALKQGYIICLCCFILFILWYMIKIGVL